jgi:hypothetical protein
MDFFDVFIVFWLCSPLAKPSQQLNELGVFCSESALSFSLLCLGGEAGGVEGPGFDARSEKIPTCRLKFAAQQTSASALTSSRASHPPKGVLMSLRGTECVGMEWEGFEKGG